MPARIRNRRPRFRHIEFGRYNGQSSFSHGVSRHDTPESLAARVRRVASVLTLTLFALGLGSFPVSARAENEGQADLDKATQQKLGAQTAGDLTEVIQLCESALKKGLDKGNAAFANDLMASALVQRGSLTANKAYRAILAAGRPGGDRRQLEDLPQRGLGRFGKRREAQPQAAAGPIRDRQAEPLARRRSPESDGGPRQDDRAGRRRRGSAGRGPGSPARRCGAIPAQRLADLDEAVRTLPGNAVVLRTRGLVLAEAEKWDDALADFDKAIAADPKQVLTYQMKALVLVKLKKSPRRLPSWKRPTPSPRTTSNCWWPRGRSSSRNRTTRRPPKN